MCGIAGALSLYNGNNEVETVTRMARLLDHRGPEVIGLYRDYPVILAHARLSIVDLEGGLQPLDNEDKSLRLICNGEVFNHVELRQELQAKGHHFRTGSDCEIIIHIYEEYGIEGFQRMVGQYAFALWDSKTKKLLLGRDRLGVRPLFYTTANGIFYFASEIKALLLCPGVERRLSPEALDQVLTFWSVLPGRTMFEGIHEVPPGFLVTINLANENPQPVLERYYSLSFPTETESRAANLNADPEALQDELLELLNEAIRIRLRADVPVGAYLSGGLDSSLVCALAQRQLGGTLRTFSVAFTDSNFDERGYQQQMARYLGTEHQVIECSQGDIGLALPDVIWHTEVPLLRLGPVPLFQLSKLVNQNRMKVVLTGEGADEFFGGYDIFKEALVRRFVAQQPGSKYRSLLFGRLHAHVPGFGDNPTAMLNRFFTQGLEDTADPLYSHRIRWRNASRLKLLLNQEVRTGLDGYNAENELMKWIPAEFQSWHPLSKAQYLEITAFLSTYLLSSQGDRVAMAHAVEGRYPFLDHRVTEFANLRVPPALKLKGLNEKWLLKKLASQFIPDEIVSRRKQPYRAPIRSVFSSKEARDYVETLLSPHYLQRSGLFNPQAAMRLWQKSQATPQLTEVDQMALTALVTCQMWDELFVRNFDTRISSSSRSVEVKLVA